MAQFAFSERGMPPRAAVQATLSHRPRVQALPDAIQRPRRTADRRRRYFSLEAFA